MFEIEMFQKGHGLCQSRIDAEKLALIERMQAEAASKLNEDGSVRKGSTGWAGKYFETLVRFFLYKDGLRAADFRAHSSSKADFTLNFNGHRYAGEIKTGDGICAAYGVNELEADDVLPGKHLIVYCTEPQELSTVDDLLDNTVVVTRDEFLQVVLTAGQKRKPNWRSGLKPGVNSKALREANKARRAIDKKAPIQYDCYTMQPTYRKARWELCQSGELTSLRTFLEEIGRL